VLGLLRIENRHPADLSAPGHQNNIGLLTAPKLFRALGEITIEFDLCGISF
jgi:hypothetical protein